MTERLDTGYASLSKSDGVYTVSGVAIGENDITQGGSGKKTLWPRETLEGAAEGLEGQPLATDVDHTADGPKSQTPVDAIVGQVTWSGYKPGVGVLYEAEMSDESLADKVQNGWLEVSPLVSRELEPLENNSDADYKATKINRWRDLATVAKGAAPSNSITVGEQTMKAEALAQHVESLQDIGRVPPQEAQDNAQKVLEWRDEHGDEVDAMTDVGWERANQLADGEELSDEVIKKMAQFNRHRDNATVADEYEGEPWKDNGHVAWLGWGGDSGVDWAIEQSDKMESMAHEALKSVAGVEFDGTATGELDESEIPTEGYEPHYLYPGENKSESSYPVVDAEGNLRRGNVDAAWSLGARGDADDDTHDSRLMELAQEFDTPPEWATEESEAMEHNEPAESGVDAEVTVEGDTGIVEVVTQSDDGGEDYTPQSSAASNQDNENMTEDNLTDDEKAILEAAEGVEEPAEALNQYAATDEPAIVAQDEFEAMQSNIDSVRGVMEDALCERTDLKESTVEALSFEALRSEFETDEGELDAEALVQVPETGQPESNEGAEALSEDADLETAEALYGDYESMANAPQRLEDDIVEALGVEDFDAAIEVLN